MRGVLLLQGDDHRRAARQPVLRKDDDLVVALLEVDRPGLLLADGLVGLLVLTPGPVLLLVLDLELPVTLALLVRVDIDIQLALLADRLDLDDRGRGCRDGGGGRSCRDGGGGRSCRDGSGAGALTVTALAVLPDAPSLSYTVRVTVYVPAAGKTCPSGFTPGSR